MGTMPRMLRRMLLCIGLAVVLTGIASGPRPGSSAPPAPETGTLWLGHLPVSYTITQEDGDYIVFPDYAANSPALVHNAALAMRQVAAQWASEGKSYKATLVFSRPLAVDEFKSFMKDAGAVAYSSDLRGLMADGEYDEAGMPPVWAVDPSGFPLIGTPQPGGDVLDPALVAEFTGHQQQFFGVIDTDVMLNAKLYGMVANDSRVYGVDIIQQALTDLVLQRHPEIPPGQLHILQSHLYTLMESAGLTPVKTQ
jgi:hypothetical protein